MRRRRKYVGGWIIHNDNLEKKQLPLTDPKDIQHLHELCEVVLTLKMGEMFLVKALSPITFLKKRSDTETQMNQENHIDFEETYQWGAFHITGNLMFRHVNDPYKVMVEVFSWDYMAFGYVFGQALYDVEFLDYLSEDAKPEV